MNPSYLAAVSGALAEDLAGSTDLVEQKRVRRQKLSRQFAGAIVARSYLRGAKTVKIGGHGMT